MFSIKLTEKKTIYGILSKYQLFYRMASYDA